MNEPAQDRTTIERSDSRLLGLVAIGGFFVFGRITRWLNKPFGFDGILIYSVGLDISFADLRGRFQTYLTRHNPTAIDDTE